MSIGFSPIVKSIIAGGGGGYPAVRQTANIAPELNRHKAGLIQLCTLTNRYGHVTVPNMSWRLVLAGMRHDGPPAVRR